MPRRPVASPLALKLALLAALFTLTLPMRSSLRAAAPSPHVAPQVGWSPLLGSVLTGAFRPLLLNYFWIRADAAWGSGHIDEARLLYRAILDLYPRNESARSFLGYLLAWNMKGDAPNGKEGDEVGWRYAEEGLDILLTLPSGGRTLALWLVQQCGQDAHRLQRYAGPAWTREKRLRTHVADWAMRRVGEPLDRFALALRLFPRPERIGDRVLVASLLQMQAVEEMLCSGESPRALEAAEHLEALAEEFADEPKSAASLRERAGIFRALHEGRLTPAMTASGRYDVAMALAGIGIHAGRRDLLAAAESMLKSGDFPEELAAIAAWIAHLDHPGGTAPPPLW